MRVVHYVDKIGHQRSLHYFGDTAEVIFVKEYGDNNMTEIKKRDIKNIRVMEHVPKRKKENNYE